MDYKNSKIEGRVSDDWVEEKNKLLKEKLPQSIQKNHFIQTHIFMPNITPTA